MNSPEYDEAIARQRIAVKELRLAGYGEKYAKKLARRWFPTPAQARIRKARTAKEKK